MDHMRNRPKKNTPASPRRSRPAAVPGVSLATLDRLLAAASPGWPRHSEALFPAFAEGGDLVSPREVRGQSSAERRLH